MLCGLSCERRAVVSAQQVLAGMNELNERVQDAEARATEAEPQAQATQQELERRKLEGKERGKVQQCGYTGARDRRVCVEVPASAV